MAQAASPGDGDLLDRLDSLPLRWLHIAILAVCSLGLAFDIAEMSIGGALSAVFSAPPHVTASGRLAWLLSAPYIGGMFGAPLFGRLADRRGRRLTLVIMLLLEAATSIAAGFSNGLLPLTLLRAACGIALGACPPLLIAYLTDVMPPTRRGPLLLVMSGLGLLGGPAAVFLIRGLTPSHPLGLEGWRWALILLGLAAALTGLLFVGMPESARWLLKVGRGPEADKIGRRFERSPLVRLLAGSPNHHPADGPGRVTAPARRPPRVVLAILFFLSPWATVAFPLLAGAVLIQKGFKLSDAFLYVGASMFGPVVGAIAVSPLFDRIGRRGALALCASGMALTGAAFTLGSIPALLVASNLIFGVFVAIYIPTLSVYAAELFETRSRGLASTSFWAVNRVGSALAPIVLVPLLRAHGPFAMFTVIGSALLASVAIVSLGPPGRGGRRVD